jgi:predicted dehydrogenase
VVSCGIGPGDLVTVESAAGATRLRADADDGAARTSYQAFYLEWRDFVESVRGGTAGGYAASTSLRTTRLVDAIYAAGGLP